MSTGLGAKGASSALTDDEVLSLYRDMVRIRLFEERAAELYRDGKIPGFVHLSVGQEAVPVGTCFALSRDDIITSNHRGHGHVLAKGLDVREAFAELFGMEEGSCRGRGGSMHIADPAIGIFGANGIVGAGVPIAAGAATASKLRQDGRVAVSFFGDGALSTGAFHEGATLASAWALPLILLCENNQFSEFSGASRVSMERRAAAYDVDFFQLDGNDVEAMAVTMRRIVEGVRAGGRPAFVEALTFRVRGHYEGDAQRYRDPKFDNLWLEKDPIDRTRKVLATRQVDSALVNGLEADARHDIEEAVLAADGGRRPDTSALFDYVRRVPADAREPSTTESAPPVKVSRAVGAALEYEMKADPNVFLAGIDIGAGNVFGLTRGLLDKFPGRVLDTPISESAIVGLGIGAAMAGMRPVIEIMYSDFMAVCFDQIINQAAKLRFMTGGKVDVPLTIRTQFGAGRSSGAQHSQSLEAMLAHVPGLTVVMPSTAADTYGLLRSAIRHDGPVIVIEHRLLYEKKDPGFDDDHIVPIGQAKVLRDGGDVTIVSYSRMVRDCLQAADHLSTEGIEAEVIDLRTIAPLDWGTILTSVAKTSRLVIAHEAASDFGVGAEISARVADEGFWNLDAPIVRVGAPSVPAPYSPPLESAWLPGIENVEAAVRRVVSV
jgi:2-oxoisovalerate dehydrogenase E1 component